MNKHCYGWELSDEIKEELHKQQKKWSELVKAARISVDKFHKELFRRKEYE